VKHRILTAAAALLAGSFSSWGPACAAEFGDAGSVIEEARARGAQYGPGILISAPPPVQAASGRAQAEDAPAPFPADAAISIQDPESPSSWKWPGPAKQSELQSTQRCFRSQSLSLAAALKSPAVIAAAKEAKPGVSRLHVWFYYASAPENGPESIRPASIAVDWIFDDGAVKRTSYEAGKYGVETKTLAGRLVGSTGVYQLAGYAGPGNERAGSEGAMLCRVEPDMIASPLQ